MLCSYPVLLDEEGRPVHEEICPKMHSDEKYPSECCRMFAPEYTPYFVRWFFPIGSSLAVYSWVIVLVLVTRVKVTRVKFIFFLDVTVFNVS